MSPSMAHRLRGFLALSVGFVAASLAINEFLESSRTAFLEALVIAAEPTNNDQL